MKRWWAAAALAGAAGTAAQVVHMRRVARDSSRASLESPPGGRPESVRSADGTSLHAEVFGAQDGQAIVLVHGWTENLSIWTHVIRDLAGRGYRVVAVDLRGHGKSERAASGDYSIARYGEDVEAVLAACVPQRERAVIAGHSLGAMSIAAWAEAHTVDGQIGAAALVNTGFGDLVGEALVIPVPGLARTLNSIFPARHLIGARGPLPRFSTPVSYAMIRYVAFGPDATPAQVAFFERMLAASPPAARASTGITISDLELYDALPRLTVPTTVIAGENDRLTPPSHARRVAEVLPQLRQLLIIPRCGHMGPLERPGELTDALIDLAGAAGQTESLAA